MKNLAESMSILARQLNRLKEVPQSDALHGTINEFPNMMEEVINFIQTWLENWTGMCQFTRDVLFTECNVQSSTSLLSLKKTKQVDYRRR